MLLQESISIIYDIPKFVDLLETNGRRINYIEFYNYYFV